MHSHDNHILNATLFHQIKRFATVGDGVLFGDFNRRMLTAPCAIIFHVCVTIAATIGIIDRQFFALTGFVEITPALQRDLRFDHRSRLSPLALRKVFVEFHSVAGTMNNEHSLSASLLNDLVHLWCHLRHSCC